MDLDTVRAAAELMREFGITRLASDGVEIVMAQSGPVRASLPIVLPDDEPDPLEDLSAQWDRRGMDDDA